ncbi:MAG: hypothetical protein OER96_07340 [Gammaproteobacteria bacterium]|nr:hypothetical protein [Gammaproteobacteria bacterium]
MTYHSKNFSTTPNPYSWLVVAMDTAIHAEQQRQSHHKPKATESEPKSSDNTAPRPSALDALEMAEKTDV